MQRLDVAVTDHLSVIEHASIHLENEALYLLKFVLYEIKFIAVVFYNDGTNKAKTTQNITYLYKLPSSAMM